MVILCQTTEAPGLISLSRFPMTGQEMCLDKMPAAWFEKKKKGNPEQLIIWGTFHPAFFLLPLADIFSFIVKPSLN